MKVIIGIIKNEKNRVEACRIFDTDSVKYEDVSINKIRHAIATGQRIVGYRLNKRTPCTRGGNVEISLRKEFASFNFNIVPQLNGVGKLIDLQDSYINTLLGWTGFAENKAYYVVNWNGKITKISQSEFKKGVINKKINGAKYDNVNNKFHFCMDLNNEMEMNLEE